MRFVGSPDADTRSVQRWIAAWVSDNQEWEVFSKTHRYCDYFRSVPKAVCDTRGFGVILEGISPHQTFWRDWCVQLTGDMLQEFPGLEDLTSVIDEP
jgi:hypothetical protein